MSTEVFVAILSLAGTLIGSLSGVLISNKLVNYRLEKLEKKQDIHNGVIERVYIGEGKIEELQHEVRDLKEELKHMRD